MSASAALITSGANIHAGGGITQGLTINNTMHLSHSETPPSDGRSDGPDESSQRRQPRGRDSGATLRVNQAKDAPPPSELYARLMMPKHCGYPLWDPKPMNSAPPKHREVGVRIGDVGRITPDGSFDFFFNICLPSSDEVNARGVPENFEPIELPSDIEQNPFAWRPGAHFVNGSVKASVSECSPDGFDGVFSFKCEAEEGAALTLPEGGSKESLNRVKRFFDYAARHAHSWRNFAIDVMERDVPNGTIYLVTGCAKTRSWGTAAWSGITGEGSFQLKFSAPANPSVDANFPFVWAHQSFAATQEGPPIVEPSERPLNQCIFLCGYSITFPYEDFGSAATVGVRHVPRHSSSTLIQRDARISNGTLLQFPNFFTRLFFRSSKRDLCDLKLEHNISFAVIGSKYRDFAHHPLYSLNRFLLELHPHAKVAITHDNLWMSVLDEKEASLPSFSELETRICQSHKTHLAKDGTVTFVALTASPDLESPFINDSLCYNRLSDTIKSMQSKLKITASADPTRFVWILTYFSVVSECISFLLTTSFDNVAVESLTFTADSLFSSIDYLMCIGFLLPRPQESLPPPGFSHWIALLFPIVLVLFIQNSIGSHNEQGREPNTIKALLVLLLGKLAKHIFIEFTAISYLGNPNLFHLRHHFRTVRSRDFASLVFVGASKFCFQGLDQLGTLFIILSAVIHIDNHIPGIAASKGGLVSGNTSQASKLLDGILKDIHTQMSVG